jgi:hypothetical protein
MLNLRDDGVRGEPTFTARVMEGCDSRAAGKTRLIDRYEKKDPRGGRAHR